MLNISPPPPCIISCHMCAESLEDVVRKRAANYINRGNQIHLYVTRYNYNAHHHSPGQGTIEQALIIFGYLK